MWGSDGATDHYIGQIALQQPFSEKQCNILIEENMSSFTHDLVGFVRMFDKFASLSSRPSH